MPTAYATNAGNSGAAKFKEIAENKGNLVINLSQM